MPRKLTVSQLKKKLDKTFSKYIRLRDALITTGTKTHALCVTCNKRLPISSMHAGHWRSRRYNATRYDERNVHAQCAGCNTFNNGMEEEHRRAIISMYSEDMVDELYKKSQEIKKFKISELERMIEDYKEEYKFIDEGN